jgi:hypothetical protein
MNANGPWWAALTVWAVVNSVNLLQSAGFLSRVATRSMSVNHAIGYAIMLLAIPATVALAAYLRAGANWRFWLGPMVFDAFVVFMLVVDYVRPVEFRSPAMPAILAPYLILFFGSIALMGFPMYRMDMRLWGVTAATSVILLASMGFAMLRGVG